MKLKHLNQKMISEVKKKLFEHRDLLMNKLEDFKINHLHYHETGQDEAEISLNNINTNLAIELQERDRLTLMRIDRALEKMEKQTYGICESCGACIEYKRLLAQPLARLCMECMQEQNHEIGLH